MTDIEIRALIFNKEFVNAWFRLLPSHNTYEAAYEALEDIYLGYFGRRKYSNYESFRQVKNRMQRLHK